MTHTPTSASLEDFIELHGKPTFVFGTPAGRSYHWFQPTRYIEYNANDDGTRTTLEREPTKIVQRW